MQWLYGDVIAQQMIERMTETCQSLTVKPTLAVVIVGEDYASKRYVKKKQSTCEIVGIRSLAFELPHETTEEDLLKLIDSLNADQTVDGILVQMPLPKHINTSKVFETINYNKDVDGLHPYNLGKVMANEPGLQSCTPKGVMTLLNYYNIDVSGKRVVVVGRSRLVGKPLAGLLVNANATVTIAHSKTQNLSEITKQADIIITAVGSPRFFTSHYFNPNAIVIDVGINRFENGLCGDVDGIEIEGKIAALTPVPKGIGPLTIACLLQNTIEAYQRARNYGI